MTNDVVLALSWSGETVELAALIDYTHRFDIPLISITSNPNSALAKASRVALVLPKVVEACPNGLAPTSSTILQMALGDAIAVALLESRGFTASDFKIYHPGGRLGAFLKTAKDVMRRGDSLPRAQYSMKMSDILLIMTEKGLGTVIIEDENAKLQGVITDGDLRRHMSMDLLSRSAVDIMTRTPRTIAPETLLSDAIAIMNELKITSLIVVENEHAVGVVHLHDLLQAGIQ